MARRGRRERRISPRIVIASDQAPRLAELLEEGGHAAGVTNAIPEPPPPGAVAVVDRSLNGGFHGGPDGLVFVTDRELFGNVRVRRPKAMRRVVPRDILERLTPGDLVVHIDHGIARYERMLRRSSGTGDERDFLELAFQGQDRIFVPVEQIGRISRYSGGESPTLSKLGGTEWLRTKQRVRKAVGDLAEELLALYAARASAPGHAVRRRHARGSPRWRPRSPTRRRPTSSGRSSRSSTTWRRSGRWTGSSSATSATARPRSRSGRRSRRSRTASRSRCSSRRPSWRPSTTRPSRPRFGPFPVTVKLLSRFVSKAEQETTVAGLAAGSVDLVIGTHRLLSKDVRFKDLGLVVVDEEQRFGVAAKERLKQLKREVDVLTLSRRRRSRGRSTWRSRASATCRSSRRRPRTACPSRRGSRRRRAGLVRDAILRELDRGGQVFYVHNRVETIEAQAEQLRKMLPDVAHRRRARPDGRGPARERDAQVRRRRGRRPGVHDDHRVRPRHPEREHDRHRPGRHARAGAALPAPRPRGPVVAPGVRVPPVPPPRAA